MLPIATVVANTVAILGGFLVSVITLDVTAETFIEGMRAYFKSSDLLGGLFKSFIFGGIIALSGIYFGMSTEGGAEGVGRATMGAVVACMLSVLVADYLLAALLFQVLFG
jgi:phospholipid/cholesterol/gamma-HCH transport system permease protein